MKKRQINRWKNIVSRCRGKLVKMIKIPGSEYDDLSIAPKIRQIFIALGIWINKKIFFDKLLN